MICVRFFLRPRAVQMRFDAGHVYVQAFNARIGQIHLSQRDEQLIKRAVVGPAAHVSVDRVPIAEMLRQSVP